MAGLAAVLAIAGLLFNVILLIVAWRAMEAHETLARSIADFVALQIKKDKREHNIDQA